MTEAEQIRHLYEARVRHEIDASEEDAGRDTVRWAGDLSARTLFVKGEPSEADAAAGAAFAGEDGDAARKALAALGRIDGGVAFTCSRPPGLSAAARDRRLLTQLEALDPGTVIAADAAAAADVARVLGSGGLAPGKPTGVRGREVLALSGLEECLRDEGKKRIVWAELRSLARQEG